MCLCSNIDESQCERLISLAHAFDENDAWLDRFVEHFDLLILDHELMTGVESEKWEIEFAVDFCDIHGYLFPFSHLLDKYAELKNDASFRRSTTLEYLARMCLFTSREPRRMPRLVGGDEFVRFQLGSMSS